MSIEPQIHPAARLELFETIRHYAVIDGEGQGELALAFESTFYHYADAIMSNPLLYNIRRSNVRRANLIPRFDEHYIAYMIWREQVVILAVAHAKRRPYYWRKRIAEAKKLF